MTIEQKQCLLYYLGYYTGRIDGIWGAKSKEATVEFQRDFDLLDDGDFGRETEFRIREVIGTGEDLVVDIPTSNTTNTTNTSKNSTGDFWDEIEFFDKSEFACKCGKCGGFPKEPQEKLIKVADRVRKHFGKPATVSSGVRCTTHNANVGGVSNSRHLSGKAMDFSIQGVGGNTLLAYVQKQPEIRYAYVIEGNWVHMDIE